MKSKNGETQKGFKSDKSEAKHRRCRGTEPFSTNSGGKKDQTCPQMEVIKGPFALVSAASSNMGKKGLNTNMLAICFVLGGDRAAAG